MRKHLGLLLVVLGALAIGLGFASAITTQAAEPSPPSSQAIQAPQALNTTYISLAFKAGGSGQAGGFIQHQDMLLNYTGAATCVGCHADEVHQFTASNHYLWQGKLGAINDFCGYPDINFGPAKLTNVSGTLLDGGCATCHPGLGAKPSLDNPNNGDCLTCHAQDYRRTAVQTPDGWRFAPDRVNMPAVIEIQGQPSRYACLTCHVSAGGGGNNKRGDLSDALINPTPDVDVHMGNGMLCTDCHLEQDHRIAGAGSDMRIDEGVAMRPCSDCHTPSSDHDPDIQQHLDKVACQSCHIPEYARAVSTDMFRDYRAVEVNARGLYEPAITRGANVTPEYAFWNGQNGFYNFGDPAVAGQARPGRWVI